MSDIETGGPAFPVPLTDSQEERWNNSPGLGSANGMTLRDYFAAKAIPLGWKVFDEGYSPDECSPENIAKFSYAMADAMLKARKA